MLRCSSCYQHEEPNETAILQHCKHTLRDHEEIEGASNFVAAVGTVVLCCEGVANCFGAEAAVIFVLTRTYRCDQHHHILYNRARLKSDHRDIACQEQHALPTTLHPQHGCCGEQVANQLRQTHAGAVQNTSHACKFCELS